MRRWFHPLIRRFRTQTPRRGGPLCPPARDAALAALIGINVGWIDPVRGQAPLPARTQLGELSRVTTTTDTNTEQRSATGQRQGEGAGLRRDVRTRVCRVGAISEAEGRDP